MAKKKIEEMTDEELAREVELKLGEPQIKRVVSADPEDGTDPVYAAKKRQELVTDEDLDRDLAEAVLAKEKEPAVSIQLGEPKITRRDTEVTDPAEKVRAGKQFDDAIPVERNEIKGSVHLANTLKDGSRERGAEIKRSQFRSDADFDKFVGHQAEEGNIYEEPREGAKGGGTLRSKIMGVLGSVTKGATPSDQSGKAAIKAAQKLDVSDIENGAQQNKPLRSNRMLAAARKDAAASASEVPLGQGMEPREQDPELTRLQNEVPAAITPASKTPLIDSVHKRFDEFNNMAPGNGSPDNEVFPGQPGALGGPGFSIGGEVGKRMSPGAPPSQDLSGVGLGATYAGNAGAAQAAPAQIPSGNRGGPGAAPAPGFPAQDNSLQREMADNAALMTQAIQHSGEIDQAHFKRAGEQRQAEENEISKQQLTDQGRVEHVDANLQRVQHDMDQTLAVISNPAKTPDPERYWKSHSKIMFALGVGMLAQAGKDIGGVLSNVNQAIDRDVEEQKAEFEAPRNAAKAKMAGLQQLYGQYRDQKHDVYEAAKMSSATMKMFYANQAEKLAANTSSEKAASQAALAAGQLREAALKDQQQALQHNQTNAVAEYNATEHARHNRAEEGIERGKAARIAAGDKAVGDSSLSTLGRMKTAMEQLGPAGDKIFGGLGQSIINTFSSKWPTGTTDAGQWDRTRDAKSRILMNIINPKERQNETERRNILETLVPKAGDADGKVRWDNTMQLIGNIFDNEVGALETRGKAGPLKQFTSPTAKPSWLKPY